MQVTSELPIIASYEDAIKGEKCNGVIVAVKDSGAFITFFGDVKVVPSP